MDVIERTERRMMALVCGMVMTGLLAVQCAPAISPSGARPVRCTEDMACWDCHTMGNRVCGPGSGRER